MFPESMRLPIQGTNDVVLCVPCSFSFAFVSSFLASFFVFVRDRKE